MHTYIDRSIQRWKHSCLMMVTIFIPALTTINTANTLNTSNITTSNTSIMEPIRWYFNRCGHQNATFIQASCNEIDIKKQTLYAVDIRGEKVEVEYDYLVVAVGAEPATFGIPGRQINM